MDLLLGEPALLPNASFLYDFFSFAHQTPKQTLLVDCAHNKEWTAEEIWKRSLDAAAYFQHIGVGPGKIVALYSHTTTDAIITYFGAWMAGASVSPINNQLKKDELKVVFGLLNPSVIYWGEGKFEIDWPGALPLVQPPLLHPNINWTFKRPKINFTTHIPSIVFTSGTTGTPKPILIKDSCINETIQKAPLMKNGNRILLTSPLLWISNVLTLALCVTTGKCLIIPQKHFDIEDVLGIITKYKPDFWLTNRASLLSALRIADRSKYDLSSLKELYSGGNVFTAEARRKVSKELFQNRLVVKHLYGSTELGLITVWPDIINITSNEYETVGKLSAGNSLKIVDIETNLTLKANQIGELCVKTTTFMAGILGKKFEEIGEIDSEGWFHTGDIGYYDEKGLIYITDRAKDIFKYKGYQIAPAEIENVLETNEAVLEACVVGVSHEEDGCRPAAVVILKPGYECTSEQLIKYVSERVPDYKQLRGGLIVSESFPLSPTGKILCKEVEKMFKT